MSSAPPPPPQQPPYDPRTQWRAYRQQQKAAWRAQREAWKAQRHAWKANYYPHVPSIVGPLILIAIGVIGFLIATGRMDAARFWNWYGHWWPLLMIGAGLAMLAEWALDQRDQRRSVPVRRGGGFVGLIVFLAILGMVAATANHWNNFRSGWGDDSGNLFNIFGKPQHDRDQQVINTQVPARAVLQIDNPRGDVSITAGDAPNVQVQAHQVAYADSDSDAQKIFNAEQTHVRVSGNAVSVQTDASSNGRVNLTIVVPRSASITVNAGRGDVAASGLGAGATISASHGDVQLSSIQGSVQVHFTNDRGDFSAHQVTGDITADGRCNDLTLSDVKGKITVNGDIFGDVHLENLIGGTHIHTSVTDLQLGDLTGDMTLDDDDLRVTGEKGGVRVTTHSKDIDLGEIAGDIFVDNRNGDISLEPAGSYNIEAHNNSGNGDIELTLPANASASISAHTHNGDIVSDFPMPSPGDDDDKTVNFAVGSGQAKVMLTTDVGDVHIKRGSPANASAPAPPNPHAPHLRAPKVPIEPVTQ